MAKFKVGDRVVCVDDQGVDWIVSGNTYTVSDAYTDDGLNYVGLKDDQDFEVRGYFAHRFFLVPQDAPVENPLQTAREVLDILIEQAEAKVEALRAARKALD